MAAGGGLFELIETLVEAGAVTGDSNILVAAMQMMGREFGERDKGIEVLSLLCKAGVSVNALHRHFGTTLEYAVWLNHRRLWPFFFRMGLAHPRPPESMPQPSITGSLYAPNRADPYLGRIEAAGGWKKYERAHLRSLSATFVPKFPRLPAEIVPLIVQFWAHVGDY